MKNALWMVAASILAVSSLGCLATATQEDIDALEQGEALDDVAAHEENLAINWDSPAYTCSGTTCNCNPGGGTSETTCEGFVRECGSAAIYCCVDRKTGTQCVRGYDALASYCFCNR